MNKVTEKILLSPINVIAWISHNLAETFMLAVYFCSVLPFFIVIKSPALLGGLLSFCSMVMVYIVNKREDKKESKLYSILGLTVIILAVCNIFISSDKQINDSWSPLENCLATYFGAMFGIIIGAILFSFIESEQESRKNQKELENKRYIVRASIPSSITNISNSEKVFVRDSDSNIIGYIEKEKYDDFISKNTIRDNGQ